MKHLNFHGFSMFLAYVVNHQFSIVYIALHGACMWVKGPLGDQISENITRCEQTSPVCSPHPSLFRPASGNLLII
jgi:hypothetical protein